MVLRQLPDVLQRNHHRIQGRLRFRKTFHRRADGIRPALRQFRHGGLLPAAGARRPAAAVVLPIHSGPAARHPRASDRLLSSSNDTPARLQSARYSGARLLSARYSSASGNLLSARYPKSGATSDSIPISVTFPSLFFPILKFGALIFGQKSFQGGPGGSGCQFAVPRMRGGAEMRCGRVLRHDGHHGQHARLYDEGAETLPGAPDELPQRGDEPGRILLPRSALQRPLAGRHAHAQHARQTGSARRSRRRPANSSALHPVQLRSGLHSGRNLQLSARNV